MSQPIRPNKKEPLLMRTILTLDDVADFLRLQAQLDRNPSGES